MIASLQITGSSQAPSTGSTPAGANVGASLQEISAVPTVNDSRLKVTEVISNLSMPTTVAFLGPNDFLLLQKSGTVSRVTNGTLVTPPLLNVTVGTGITQGMLGVATSNVSKTNSTYVFLYYTEVINMNQTNDLNQDQNQSNASASEPLQNRLYRYELVNDKLVNPKLLAVLPAKEGYMDNGGYLKIGPDNNLYFSVGAVTASDVSDIQTLTQNFVNGTPVDGRAGILRMTQDGDPVLDEEGRGLLGNSSPLNLYYGYGLKDSFGMDFDPITGNLWDAEPGRIINDEINLVKPGFNGGFEAIQGQSVYTPAAPADLVDFNGTGIYRNPEFVWTQKVVPIGLTYLNSNKLGTNYENDLFLGSFLNGNIYHFDLNENRTQLIVPSAFVYKTMATWNSTGASNITFGKGFGDISSLTVGPDGYLYVVSFGNGAIYKIEPT
jgi:glucose/arabinose dehydrogenase